jgi:hypothetical protein
MEMFMGAEQGQVGRSKRWRHSPMKFECLESSPTAGDHSLQDSRSRRSVHTKHHEENTGWGWKTVGDQGPDDGHSDHLQDDHFRTDQRHGETARAARAAGIPYKRAGDHRPAGPIIFSTLNGLLYGMLLFLLERLTLIFSMMGVNFAHASFYMLGATSLSDRPLCQLLAGPGGRAAAGGRSARWRYGLRRHKHGHVAELLFTFGLAFIIEELVQMIWGKIPVDYRVPRR